jgi:hypothetical protein
MRGSALSYGVHVFHSGPSNTTGQLPRGVSKSLDGAHCNSGSHPGIGPWHPQAGWELALPSAVERVPAPWAPWAEAQRAKAQLQGRLLQGRMGA